jgi:hypothetical protein
MTNMVITLLVAWKVAYQHFHIFPIVIFSASMVHATPNGGFPKDFPHRDILLEQVRDVIFI